MFSFPTVRVKRRSFGRGFFFFLAAWLCFIRPFGFRTEDVKLFFELLNSAESREIFIV